MELSTTPFRVRPDQKNTLDVIRGIEGLPDRSTLIRHLIDEYARLNADAIAQFEADREAARARTWAMINQARAARKAQLGSDPPEAA
jgi:hypothetical protein